MNPRIAFVLVLVLGVSLDLWSKDWAFDLVPEGARPVEVIEGVFFIDRAENPGAMWSLFTSVPQWIWIILRGSVAIGLFFYYRALRPTGWLGNIAFGMVMAGALGNVYDNCFWREGMVRDFLRVDFHRLGYAKTFPIFNVADSMICVGAPLLLFFLYRLDAQSASEKAR